MRSDREGLKGAGLDGGEEEWGSLGSLALMPGSASQLHRGETEFKTPGKTFFLGLNIV